MIDFACKKFNIEEVIKCSLNLSKSEYLLLKTLMRKKNSSFTTSDLQKETSLDLSTIQRGMKKLHESGIILRSQQNIEGGGYLFLYKITSKEEIRGKIKLIIEKWAKRVDDEFTQW